MPGRQRPAMVWFWCLACAACSGTDRSSPTAPSPPAAVDFSTHRSSRFTFRYTSIDSSTIARTASALEAEVDRIAEDIGVGTLPPVTVTLYPSGDALRQSVGNQAGPIPSFATGLVTGPTAIHVISPNLSTTWSYGDGVTAIVHEFAHCVSLVANPGFANNPRWLWESVALFEAGQVIDPRTLPYFACGGTPPSLAQLNSVDSPIVYSVGATFGRFIVETRGWEAYRQLIRSSGDIAGVLQTSEAAFLVDWRTFVRAVFGIVRAPAIANRS